MSVVSAKHAHTPTGAAEHGSAQAQDAVATAPARDANATNDASSHGNGHAYGHTKAHGNGHAYGHTKAHGNGHANGHTKLAPTGAEPAPGQPAKSEPTDPGRIHEAAPIQRDLPTGDGETQLELDRRVEIARQAWDKFNFPTVDRGLLT